jgi:iron complex transport system ATP-binding protein
MSDARCAVRATGLAVTLGARSALCGVSLELAFGEVTAILGPNGAGKSTLLRALGQLVPYAGEVRYGSDDARALTARERALRVAYVPQQTELRAPLCVRDVVALGRFAHGARVGKLSAEDARAVDAALADTELTPFAARSFLRLSGGEQRRVLIARALASAAPILLLDEPTAGLDVRHVLETHRLLRRIAARGCAVALVLHDLDDARAFADRALLLEGGRIVAHGTPAEVVSTPFVRAVYGVQLREQSGLRFAAVAEEEPC